MFSAIALAVVPMHAAAADAAVAQANDRAIKRTQAQIDRLQRSYDKHMKRCSSDDENACSDARDELAQIQNLRAGLPVAQ